VFQQVPLNVIESNTELISYYRRKREAELFSSDIPGITVNSIDSWESLSEGAKLALAAVSNSPSTNDLAPQSASFFKELADQTRHQEFHSRQKRYSYQPTNRIDQIFNQYEQLASDYGRKHCDLFSESDRRLPGDVIYGVHTQFESQSKLALSIAHFLSSFYQIINTEEDFPLRNAEKAISEDNMFAEVISAVASDFQAVGVGVFFDRNKFNKEKAYFGPYAFRVRDSLNVEIQKHYQMVDLTGMDGGYIEEDWFQVNYCLE
jgi:hypothetical protein